jgi:oligopeptidase A
MRGVTNAAASLADNPLHLAHEGLPRFDRIRVEHVEPAIRALCERMRASLEAHERTVAAAAPTWEAVVAPLTDAGEPLRWAWGVVNHLAGVKDSPELRKAREAVQGDVVRVQLAAAQSRPIYDALGRLRASPAWGQLDLARRRVVESMRRDAELAGVGLAGAERERFQALALELDELSMRFQNHVLDATKAFALTLTTREEVEGLPPTLLAQAAAGAKAADAQASGDAQRGPWRIGLDGASFVPFMQHARRRDLRERLHRAFITRASAGVSDNTPVIERILAARAKQARLLGKGSYAEVSLAAKMAPSVAAVEALLGELRVVAKPRAIAEHAELTAFARQEGGDAALELSPWDIGFWAERLRERRYAYSDEALRPYFALPRVLDGLFALAERLFGVRVRAADGEAPVWDPAVRFFRVCDERGRDIAAFYLDPYSRPADKRGGAWMDNALDRKSAEAGVRAPVAYLVCNQTPPVASQPSLMTFREVETLFHEFGHGLQHLLTTVDVMEAAGINNVEWDAVELPSQFMENWCYHWPTISRLAHHWQSGETLPRALFDKVASARTYRAAWMTMRQLAFADVDLELHHRYRPGDAGGALAVQSRIAELDSVIPPLPDDRSLCSFSHIFAGGYAAGYYSYKWAEVLSADAFDAFAESGLDDERAVAATGRRFRDTVLALGGSRHPLEVFTAFRGRGPSVRPLLKQLGLA